MPAVYDLANRGLLPPGFALVGFARRDWDDQDFEQVVHDAVQAVRAHAVRRGRLAAAAQAASASCRASSTTTRPSTRLKETLEELDRDRGTMGNHAFYLSIPPKSFPQVTEQLRRSGLAEQQRRPVAPRRHREAVRLRPQDRARAQRRRRERSSRPTACSASTTTSARRRCRTSWRCASPTSSTNRSGTRNYVDHVQITMAEDIGVGGRAGYYDGIGAARDVIQNHLLQLLALTAMEEPVSFDAADLRAEKEKVLSAVQLPERPRRRATARGQYSGGWQGGEKVARLPRGGRDEPEVAHRDLRRDPARHRHAPLGRRAVLPARRQAPRPPRHRDRGRVQARAAVPVRREPDLGARPERARDPRAARRGRHDPLRLEGARRRACRCATSPWTSATATRSPRPAPRRTSDSSSTCCSATRRCSPATRRSSCSWKILDPIEEYWATHGPARAVHARAPGARHPPTSCWPATARVWRRP